MSRSPAVVYAGGWAGHRHVGDDAILRAHVTQLSELAPEARPLVLGPEPEVLAERFGVEAVEGLNPVLWRGLDLERDTHRALIARSLRAVRAARYLARGQRARVPTELLAPLSAIGDACCVVVAAAGAIAAEHSVYGLFPLVTTLAAARAFGVPAVVSGATIGPFLGFTDRLAVAAGLHGAAHVWVRDRATSARELRKLAIRSRETWDDSAWLPDPSEAKTRVALAAVGLEPGAAFAALTTAPFGDYDGSPEALAAVADRLHAERGIPSVAVPMDTGSRDRQTIERLRERLRAPEAVRELWPLSSDGAIKAIVGQAKVAYGGRFHGAVFAALAGTPALLVHHGPYQRRKAIGLARLTGPRLRPLAATAPAAELGEAVLGQLERGRADPVVMNGPIPAAAWAAAKAGNR